jgi:Ca2+-binding RTX toxin-like protein
MTTTPTIWKSSFVVNSGFTAGSQTVPQTIGLKNGNILVVWEDDTNGPSPYIDVVGRVFDPEGHAIGNPFQVNALVTVGDETGPKIVALPDGGYVVAYGGYSVADGGFIVVQRFNSNNEAVSERFITDARSSLTGWEITADSAGNYTVVFEQQVAYTAYEGFPAHPVTKYSIDIHSITYNYSDNAPGVEQTNNAQNSSDPDRLGATAAFGDGRIVTFYTEPDDWYFSYIPPLQVPGTTFEFTITDPFTGDRVRNTEIAEPETREGGRAQDVAILTGGQIVLLYSINRSGGELAMKIVADGSASGSISAEKVIDNDFSLDGDDARGFENARAVALQDGGFLVAWIVDVFLFAARYDATGAMIGSKLIVDQHVATGQTALFNLSLTGDGRVLIPFVNNAGEIAEAILDPRNTTISGSESSDVLTTQTTSTSLFGLGGDDTLLGQNGNDQLDGGLGRDLLDGGGGNDTYTLRDLGLLYIFFDPVLGIQTVFGYDAVIEAANGGTDTVLVRHVSPPNSYDIRSYTLEANVENGIIQGNGFFDLTGNGLNNALTGNGAANTLAGGSGDDRLDGSGGDDQLIGGRGLDQLRGGPGSDTLTGNSGADKFDFTTALGKSNVDNITDFAVGVDLIRIDNAIFTGLAAKALPSGPFYTGAAAHDGNDHIIYNPANGKLFFDVDGTGAIAQVRFATLDPGLALSAGDFFVI